MSTRSAVISNRQQHQRKARGPLGGRDSAVSSLSSSSRVLAVRRLTSNRRQQQQNVRRKLVYSPPPQKTLAPQVLESTDDGKKHTTIINVKCAECCPRSRQQSQCCGGGWNQCPVFDTLGYPYYPVPNFTPVYLPPMVTSPYNYVTTSPLGLSSPPVAFPLPTPAFPGPLSGPCIPNGSVSIPYQGLPGACQFPQLYPSYASNFLPAQNGQGQCY